MARNGHTLETGQAGEAYVTYLLALNGWKVLSLNVGRQTPNVDLMALRRGKRITVQVKAAYHKSNGSKKFGEWLPAGRGSKDSYDGKKSYFNSVKGEIRADVVALVSFGENSPVPICLFVPCNKLEKLVKKFHRAYVKRNLNKTGKLLRPEGPIWLPLIERPKTNHPYYKLSIDELAKWSDDFNAAVSSLA